MAEEKQDSRKSLNPREDDQEQQKMQIGKSWFFGIGINHYKYFPNLNNAVKDVKELLALLQESYGLHPANTKTLFNEQATRANIIQILDKFKEDVKPGDELLIYYSGHGHLSDNTKKKRGFWIPTNAQEGATAQYVRNAVIREYIEDIDTLHTLLISDSCFAGSIFLRNLPAPNLALEELAMRKSRWALCSGRHDEQVCDGEPGGHSPFAGSLLNVLQKNTAPMLNVSKIAEEVTYVTRANYKQLPEGNPMFGVGHEGGQYVFRRVDRAVAPAEEPKLLHTFPQQGKQSQLPSPPLPNDFFWWSSDFYWLRHWKTIVVSVAVLVLATIVVVKLYSPEPEQPSLTSAELNSKINNLGLDTSNIHFELNDNQVIVSGEVNSPQDTGGIMTALRGISEIGEIDNQLTIKQQPAPTPASPSPSISVQSNGDELAITITKGAAPYELKLTKDGREKYNRKLSDGSSHKINLTKYRGDPGKYVIEVKDQDGKLKSEHIDIAPPETGTVADSEGRQYPTIRLNGKEWLAENLNAHVGKESWCYQNYPVRCDRSGRLYAWEAAKAACADLGSGRRWRLPSDSEWKDLIKIYEISEDGTTGNNKTAYEALKDGGWSGLNLKKGGMHTIKNRFEDVMARGYYWTNSATDSNNQHKETWIIYIGNEQIGQQTRSVSEGLSCRCIKD